MKALKKLAAEQQQSPLVKDIEREYKKVKEKASSKLKQIRLLNTAMGLGALMSAAITGFSVMNDKIDDAKMLGYSTLGIAMMAVGGVKGLKNTVYSLENKAMLNVIEPYLDGYEKDCMKNTFTNDNSTISISGTAAGFFSAGSAYLGGLISLGDSASVATLTGGASVLAEEVIKAKDIKENHRLLSDKVRLLTQKCGR